MLPRAQIVGNIRRQLGVGVHPCLTGGPGSDRELGHRVPGTSVGVDTGRVRWIPLEQGEHCFSLRPSLTLLPPRFTAIQRRHGHFTRVSDGSFKWSVGAAPHATPLPGAVAVSHLRVLPGTKTHRALMVVSDASLEQWIVFVFLRAVLLVRLTALLLQRSRVRATGER